MTSSHPQDFKSENKPALASGSVFANHKPAIELDCARYLHFLEELDASDTEKQEMIEALWKIVVGFVELGFGVHPLQSARRDKHESKRVCGQTDLASGQKENALIDYKDRRSSS